MKAAQALALDNAYRRDWTAIVEHSRGQELPSKHTRLQAENPMIAMRQYAIRLWAPRFVSVAALLLVSHVHPQPRASARRARPAQRQ